MNVRRQMKNKSGWLTRQTVVNSLYSIHSLIHKVTIEIKKNKVRIRH